MELTFFVKEGKVYTRQDETHVQYIYSVHEVISLLKGVGFDVVDVSGHLGEQLKQDSQRNNFIAIKR